MKTLADLKRDAKSGNYEGEMVVRYGSSDIPERLQGRRKLIDANSVGISFLNQDGKKSECRIDAASLVEYNRDTLTIYNPGLRDLTEEEQRIMDAWKRITETPEYQQRAAIDMLSDGSSTYWQQKSFFEKSSCPWLFGTDKIAGKKYDYRSGKVYDNKVKGDVILQYKIYNVA